MSNAIPESELLNAVQAPTEEGLASVSGLVLLQLNLENVIEERERTLKRCNPTLWCRHLDRAKPD